MATEAEANKKEPGLTQALPGCEDARVEYQEPTASMIISRLSNDELHIAISFAQEFIKARLDTVPYIITAKTWDKSYGDTHPDGWVMACPDTRAYKGHDRMEIAAAKFSALADSGVR